MKYDTQKSRKIIGWIFLILLIVLLLFTLGTFLYHRTKRNQEIALLQEKGL